MALQRWWPRSYSCCLNPQAATPRPTSYLHMADSRLVGHQVIAKGAASPGLGKGFPAGLHRSGEAALEGRVEELPEPSRRSQGVWVPQESPPAPCERSLFCPTRPSAAHPRATIRAQPGGSGGPGWPGPRSGGAFSPMAAGGQERGPKAKARIGARCSRRCGGTRWEEGLGTVGIQAAQPETPSWAPGSEDARGGSPPGVLEAAAACAAGGPSGEEKWWLRPVSLLS